MTVIIDDQRGLTSGRSSIGVWGNVGRGFAHPVDVAHDPTTGQLYVVNRSTSWDSAHGCAVRISILDRAAGDADVIGEFGRRGTDPGQLMAPVAVAVENARVAITDEHSHTVNVFSADGTFSHRFGGPGDAPGRFHHPAGVAADPDGLWVVDAGNDRIQRVSWDGEPQAVIGAGGLGPGQFDHPWMIHHAAGRLWVADWGNDRIQVLDPSGRCEIVLGSPGRAPFHRPSAVAVGDDGTVYVADWGHSRLMVFDHDLARIDVWYGSAELSAWARDRMQEFPVMGDSRRSAADPAGERLLGRPGGLCVMPDGDVIVADTAHHRLQRYGRATSEP